MKYYFSLTHYVVIFILLGAFSFAAIPKIQIILNELSDSLVRSEMNKVRGEIMFMNTRTLSFRDVCYQGNIYSTLENIAIGYSKKVSCRTNRPEYTELLVCAQLKGGRYICTDSHGINCEVHSQPKGYRCKIDL